MEESIFISQNFNNQFIFCSRKENFKQAFLGIKKVNYISALLNFISFGYITKNPEEASLLQMIKSALKIHEFAILSIRNAAIEELKRIENIDQFQFQIQKNIAFLNQKVIQGSCESIQLKVQITQKQKEIFVKQSPFFDALRKVLIAPCQSYDQANWEIHFSSASMAKIKMGNPYIFQVDEKFASIDIIEWLCNIALMFDGNMDELQKHIDHIQAVLINGIPKIGFNRVDDRINMITRIQHMVYAIAKQNLSDQAVKESIKAAFYNFLKETIDCKYSWEKALDLLIPFLEKECDCCSCKSHLDKLNEQSKKMGLLNGELEKLAEEIKISTFKKAVFQAYQNHWMIYGVNNNKDSQQVHTLNYYATQLKELNIPYESNDQFTGCALKNVHKSKIKEAFLELYQKELFIRIKNKLSYTHKDKSQDFKDQVSLWVRMIATKDMKKRLSNNQIFSMDQDINQIIANMYPEWIWDDDYKVRDQFVYFLLHTFGFIKWDASKYHNHPINKNFKQNISEKYPIDSGLEFRGNKIISTIEVMRNELFPNQFDLKEECRN